MNVHRIPPAYAQLIAAATAQRAAEAGRVRKPNEAATTRDPAVIAPHAAGQPAQPSPIAPRGAALWGLLNSEEQAFFAAPSTSPPTYRPGGRPVLPTSGPTGRHVDVEA